MYLKEVADRVSAVVTSGPEGALRALENRPFSPPSRGQSVAMP